MEIGPVRNNQAKPPSSDTERPQKAQPKPAEAVSADRVEISDSARQKLAELADQTRADDARLSAANRTTNSEGGERAEPVPSHLSRQDRLAEIRRRVQSGFYDRDDVKRDIADNLSDDLVL